MLDEKETPQQVRRRADDTLTGGVYVEMILLTRLIVNTHFLFIRQKSDTQVGLSQHRLTTE